MNLKPNNKLFELNMNDEAPLKQLVRCRKNGDLRKIYSLGARKAISFQMEGK